MGSSDKNGVKEARLREGCGGIMSCKLQERQTRMLIYCYEKGLQSTSTSAGSMDCVTVD